MVPVPIEQKNDSSGDTGRADDTGFLNIFQPTVPVPMRPQQRYGQARKPWFNLLG